MGDNSLRLLRMLEPAVRPVQGGAATTRQAPIEERSFDSLLAEARGIEDDADGPDGHGGQKAEPNMLGPLAQFDAIDNASLRDLVSRAVASRGTGGNEDGSGNG